MLFIALKLVVTIPGGPSEEAHEGARVGHGWHTAYPKNLGWSRFFFLQQK